jgi:hypothetical protein
VVVFGLELDNYRKENVMQWTIDIPIKVGMSRIVFIFPLFGIVVKIPRVQLKSAFSEVIHMLELIVDRKPPLKEYITCLFGTYQGSIWSITLQGFWANINEWCFYITTHHPFVEPTFSILGLINIQVLRKTVQVKEVKFWRRMYGITNGGVWSDHHHFANPDNFCVDKSGHLRILDYGERKTQMVIRSHGHHIWRKFRPHDIESS